MVAKVARDIFAGVSIQCAKAADVRQSDWLRSSATSIRRGFPILSGWDDASPVGPGLTRCSLGLQISNMTLVRRVNVWESVGMNEQPVERERRMRAFDAQGTALDPDMMVPHGLDDVANAAFADAASAGMHHGHNIRCLFRFEGPGGFSLCRMWLKQGFTTPRHRHDVDCLYFVLGGSVRAGNTVLGKGAGLFVPAGTIYFLEAGPDGVEVLEFRSGSAFDVEYVRNNADHWAKVVGAIADNAGVWQEQIDPPFKT